MRIFVFTFILLTWTLAAGAQNGKKKASPRVASPPAATQPSIVAAESNYDKPESISLPEQAPETPPPEAKTLLNARSDNLSDFPSLRLYLKPESNGFVTLKDIKHPEATWKDCAEQEKKNKEAGNPGGKTSCIAWPDTNSEITRMPFVDPKKDMPTGQFDPKTGKEIREDLLYVRVEYERGTDGKSCSIEAKTDPTCKKISQEGWISNRYLSTERYSPLLPETPSTAPKYVEPCDQKEAPAHTINNQTALAKIGQNSATEQLKNMIGQCHLKPPNDKEPHLSKWRAKNIYDVEVLKNMYDPPIPPETKGAKKKVPSVLKEDKTFANWNDMVNIDALARTIYSEMNECFKDGVEYPMAAAKVALNRVDKVENNIMSKIFLKSWFHDNDKPTLAKVLTADRQFSVWNYMSQKNDKTVLMSLCPTRTVGDKNNWKGSSPSAQDVKIWNQAREIAMEAVLSPEKFKAKTKDVKQLYYTSKMSQYANRTRPDPIPRIGGRKVESFKCMYLWNGVH